MSSIFFPNTKVLRLNLKGVRELLNRHVDHFDDLTVGDRELISQRFAAYCKRGKADFSPGCEASKFHSEQPPSIDNLPNKFAVKMAVSLVKGGAA